MPKTLTQKLFEEKCKRQVAVGEIVEIPVDLAWGSEMTLKFAIDVLQNNHLLEGEYDALISKQADKVMFPFDHLIPATDARAASLMVDLREFADRFRMRIFEVGYDGGIQHRIFEERGFIFPGTVGVGADSHSCTYGALSAIGTGIGSTDLASVILSGKTWLQVPGSISVHLSGKPHPSINGKDIILYLLGVLGVDGANYQSLEFSGEGIKYLNMASRFTISNMAIEGGAKFGLFPSDQITCDYLINTVAKNFPDEVRFDYRDRNKIPLLEADKDADYTQEIKLFLDTLEPMVALPYLPENVLGVHQLNYILRNREVFSKDEIINERINSIAQRADEKGEVPVHQVFIGSCTNGRIEDLRTAAEILKGKRVAKGVRVVIIPASQQVFRQALKENLIEIFLDSGCYVESSSCGPCIGMKSGVMGKNEVAVFTSNRNFYGRTGDKKSFVILSSPAVAATSALKGKLCSPGSFNDYYSSEQELIGSIKRLVHFRKNALSNAESIYYQAKTSRITTPRKEHGNTAWCFNNDINTDLIMPSRFCNVTEPKQYKNYLLLDAENPDFLQHLKDQNFTLTNDIIVAGKNFGCGSSRESAPMGIKVAGISFVVAHSFARIFFRNAINIGLPVFEIGNAAYSIKQGDKLEADFDTGMIFNLTQNTVYQAKAMGEFQKKIHRSGGLMPYVIDRAKKELATQTSNLALKR